jgi:hypothetical protein
MYKTTLHIDTHERPDNTKQGAFGRILELAMVTNRSAVVSNDGRQANRVAVD